MRGFVAQSKRNFVPPRAHLISSVHTKPPLIIDYRLLQHADLGSNCLYRYTIVSFVLVYVIEKQLQTDSKNRNKLIFEELGICQLPLIFFVKSGGQFRFPFKERSPLYYVNLE